MPPAGHPHQHAGCGTSRNSSHDGTLQKITSSAKRSVVARSKGVQAAAGVRVKGTMTENLSNSVFYFSMDNDVRRFCIRVARSSKFELVVLMVVVVSSLVFAAINPLEPMESDRNRFLNLLQHFFTAFFVIECMIKVIADGFLLDPGSYLRNSWNILDFLCVLGAVLSFLPGLESSGAMKLLRTLRVVRPLSAIQRFPTLQLLANTLFAAMVQMRDVAIMLLVFVGLMGTIGLQVFAGKLLNRCYLNDANGEPTREEVQSIYGALVLCNNHGDTMDTSYHCEEDQTCARSDSNPNAGCTSFDNIFLASLTVFQSMTGEGWTDVQYYLMDSAGYISGMGFMFVVMAGGSLLMMNLSLAVVYTCYSEQKARAEHRAYLAVMAALQHEKDLEENFRAESNHKESIFDFAGAAVAAMKIDKDRAQLAALKAENAALSQKRSRSLSKKYFAKKLRTLRMKLFSSNMPQEKQSEHTPSNTVPNNNHPPQEKLQPAHNLGLSSIEGKVHKDSDDSDFEGERFDFSRMPSHDMLAGTSALPNQTSVVAWQVLPLLRSFVASSNFENIMLGVVMFNVIILCTIHAHEPAWVKRWREGANFFCVMAFLVEFLMKLGVQGPHTYFGNLMNRLDFTLVIISMAEILEDYLANPLRRLEGVQVLRICRVFRIIKIMKSFPGLQAFTASTLRASQALGSFLCLTAILMFVAALVGMQLFAGSMPHSRFHYDNLHTALLTTFQVLTGENWNETMYDAVAGNGFWACLYFVADFVLLNTVVLNLIISVLIDNCSTAQSQDFIQEASEKAGSAGEPCPDSQCELVEQRNADSNNDPDNMGYSNSFDSSSVNRSTPQNSSENPFSCSERSVRGLASIAAPASRQLKKIQTMRKLSFMGGDLRRQLISRIGNSKSKPKPKPEFVIAGTSCWIWPQDSQFRLKCLAVVSSKSFEVTMMCMIWVSSALLPFEADPDRDLKEGKNQYEQKADALLVMNQFFGFVFILEMVLKVVVMGFALGPTSYLRDDWNIIDLVVVVTTMLSLEFPQLTACKVFRAFRPLRIISHEGHLRVVVASLVDSLRRSANVCIVGLLLVLVFSITGLLLFVGQFWECSNPEILYKSECSGMYFDQDLQIEMEAEWRRSSLAHFDNIFHAALSVIEISSLEMWPDLMIVAIDTTKVDQGPSENNKPWVALYFVTVVVMMSIFFINFFVGIVVDTYNQINASEDLEGLSDVCKDWHYIMKTAKKQKPMLVEPKKANPMQERVHALVTHPFFEAVFLALIVVNSLVLMIQYYGQPHAITTDYEMLIMALTAAFALEMSLKLVGMGVNMYFQSLWNTFDLFLVIVTGVPYLVPTIQGTDWIRMLRLLRGLHLMRYVKGIGVIIQAVQKGMPQTVSVLMVTFLVMYIYAIVGMVLFGEMNVKNGEFLSGDKVGFDSFITAMITLARCASGESYNGIMHEVAECKHGVGCDFAWMSYPFMVSFVFVVQFMLVNLVVAVVLDNYSKASEDERRVVNQAVFSSFQRHWQKHDPSASGLAPVASLDALLASLRDPIGFNFQMLSRGQLVPILQGLDLPIYSVRGRGRKRCKYFVEFQDVILALAARAVCLSTMDHDSVAIVHDTLALHEESTAKLYSPEQEVVVETYTKGNLTNRASGLLQSMRSGVAGPPSEQQTDLVRSQHYRAHHWMAAAVIEGMLFRAKEKRGRRTAKDCQNLLLRQ